MTIINLGRFVTAAPYRMNPHVGALGQDVGPLAAAEDSVSAAGYLHREPCCVCVKAPADVPDLRDLDLELRTPSHLGGEQRDLERASRLFVR
jgi:hypothetical protein